MTKELLRGQIYWINLDPAIGTEVKKTRPALIISNDIQNSYKQRCIIAPITSSCNKIYPFEVLIEIRGKKGKIMLDQIRTVDCQRIGSYIESLVSKQMEQVSKALKLVLALN